MKSEITEALRRYGFYVFDRSKLELVREVVKLIGDLRPLIKVRDLPQNPNYFILEIDTYTFEASCRERCVKNGLVNHRCYSKCVTDNYRSVVEKIVAAINR